MAQASRSTAAKRRSTSSRNGSQGGARQTTRKRTSSSRSTSRSGTNARSSNSGNARSSSSTSPRSSHSNSSGIVPVITAAAGAAAGVVGGLLVGRKTRDTRRKVLGVPIPGSGGGFDGLAKNVGEAAKQFSRLAGEVREARDRAEKVGKALS